MRSRARTTLDEHTKEDVAPIEDVIVTVSAVCCSISIIFVNIIITIYMSPRMRTISVRNQTAIANHGIVPSGLHQEELRHEE